MLTGAVRFRADFPYKFMPRRHYPVPEPPFLFTLARHLTLLPQTPSPALHELISVAYATFRLRSCHPVFLAGFAWRKLSVASMSTGAGEKSGAGILFAEFPLSASNSLKIHKGDITRWSVDGISDAIVNPANERMLGGGGADGAIHRAAGPELRESCYKVPEVRPGVRCPTGEARLTPGFKLPAAYVIHTVGPIYDEDRNPGASLRSAYMNSLSVAKENKIQYIAFPAISCGVYRYPLDEAATVAISTVKEFSADLKEVHFVLFSDEIYDVWVEKAKQLVGN